VPGHAQELTVMRVVLANPLTTDEILTSVLEEQCTIVLQQDIQSLLEQVNTLCGLIVVSHKVACA